MSLLILVVDDERDVEALFRQQLRRDLRAGRFTMEFAYSASAALDRIENAAEASLIQPIQRFLAAGWPIKGSWIAYLDLHHLSHRDQASGIFD
jgi:CheY-like chemotaxis protein